MGSVMNAYQAACAGIVGLMRAAWLISGVTDIGYFGHPHVHEDDAERTVRAALDIITAVPRLETSAAEPLAVRIGIATGLVMVGDLSSEGALRERAVVGDTPNLSAACRRWPRRG
jgi:class 3 adenylate cyclase